MTGPLTLRAGMPRLLAVSARLGSCMLWLAVCSLLKVRGSAILRTKRRLTQSRLGLFLVSCMIRVLYIPLESAPDTFITFRALYRGTAALFHGKGQYGWDVG